MGTVPLSGQRVDLRQFRPDDATAMLTNWSNDPDIARFCGWAQHRSLVDAAGAIGRWIGRYAQVLFYHWAIVLKGNDDEPIGMIGAWLPPHDGVLQVGYVIGPNWQGQGLAGDAYSAVLCHLWLKSGAKNIRCLHEPGERPPQPGPKRWPSEAPPDPFELPHVRRDLAYFGKPPDDQPIVSRVWA
jgi:RimJ/RimL family protein N-acetyltransferase